MTANWLIWSNEHQAWWRPSARGYTTNLGEAGAYTRKEAVEIVVDANAGGPLPKGHPCAGQPFEVIIYHPSATGGAFQALEDMKERYG